MAINLIRKNNSIIVEYPGTFIQDSCVNFSCHIDNDELIGIKHYGKPCTGLYKLDNYTKDGEAFEDMDDFKSWIAENFFFDEGEGSGGVTYSVISSDNIADKDNNTNSGLITGKRFYEGLFSYVGDEKDQLVKREEHKNITVGIASNDSHAVQAKIVKGLMISGQLMAIGTFPAYSMVLAGTTNVPGANPGDVVSVEGTDQLVMVKAVVTATNTVSLYIYNCTDTTISLAQPVFLKCVVFKPYTF